MIEYKTNSCEYDIKDFIKQIIVNEFSIDYWDEWLEEQDYESLKVMPNIFVSCEKQNRLIGICSIKVISSNECYLNSFYVLKEFRNKGIGTQLYNMCENYAREKGFKGINLIVDPHFKEAIKFYEKINYVFDKYDSKEIEIHYHKDIN